MTVVDGCSSSVLESHHNSPQREVMPCPGIGKDSCPCLFTVPTFVLAGRWSSISAHLCQAVDLESGGRWWVRGRGEGGLRVGDAEQKLQVIGLVYRRSFWS